MSSISRVRLQLGWLLLLPLPRHIRPHSRPLGYYHRPQIQNGGLVLCLDTGSERYK